MGGHNLVAVYNLREDAERVRDRLIALGIPGTDIRLSSASDGAGAAAVTQTEPPPGAGSSMSTQHDLIVRMERDP